MTHIAGKFYSKKKRDHVLTTALCTLRSKLIPKGRRPHHLLTLRTLRMKSEAEARMLMAEAANRVNSVSPLRTTSLTHMGLKQGRKKTHRKAHRWWTEPERA